MSNERKERAMRDDEPRSPEGSSPVLTGQQETPRETPRERRLAAALAEAIPFLELVQLQASEMTVSPNVDAPTQEASRNVAGVLGRLIERSRGLL